MIDVDQRQLSVIMKTLRGSRQAVSPRMVGSVGDATALLGLEAKNGMGVDKGELVESEWDGVTYIGPGEVKGKVTMQKPGRRQLAYAWIEEKGGVILPKPSNRLQRLVWMDKFTGRLIFARRVYHRGKHYMENALIAKGSEAESIILSGMTGLFDTFD